MLKAVMDKRNEYQQGRNREEREQNEKFTALLLIIALVFLGGIAALNYLIPGFV